MKRRWVTSKAEKALLVNQRRFISVFDLFPLAPANHPWVSEDEMGQGWTKLGRIEMDYIWVNLKNVGPPFFKFISKSHLNSWKIILSCYVAVILIMRDSCSANLTFRSHN